MIRRMISVSARVVARPCANSRTYSASAHHIGVTVVPCSEATQSRFRRSAQFGTRWQQTTVCGHSEFVRRCSRRIQLLNRLPPRLNWFIRTMLNVSIGYLAAVGAVAILYGNADGPRLDLVIAFGIGAALSAGLREVPPDIQEAYKRTRSEF